jgi:GNAT superfamily N-acetyltransferase
VAAQREHRLWVAVTSGGTPVGFAIALQECNSAFLQEIDVHPTHQHKGLGRRLIQEVVDWGKTRKCSCVSLTTFEHVPWNAPFYSRLGFRKLAAHELSRKLIERLELERQQGLRQRIAMQLELDPKLE